jgi:hypothetical protein
MSKFDEREKAFEAKYKLDQEQAFKANARRCKLIGLWAAEKMGLSGEDAEAYAKDVVAADFEKPGQDDVVEKLLKDLTAKGVDISDHMIRIEMERFYQEAVKQVSDESK